MGKKVLKFGGTSVGSIERIVHAAKIIKKEHIKSNEIIVVVSAMSGKTNELISQSKLISKNFNKRELDVLLTSGEQVTSALLAGALNELGVKSKSLCSITILAISKNFSLPPWPDCAPTIDLINGWCLHCIANSICDFVNGWPEGE